MGELDNSITDSSGDSETQPLGSSPPSAGHLGSGGGAGGGFFSLPTVVLSSGISASAMQFGGGGMFRGAAMGYGVPNSNVHFSNDRRATLMELIIDNIDGDSWEVNGGGATILAVNDSLLIR